MTKKIACLVLILVLTLSSFSVTVFAAQPDKTFTYEGETAVPSTNIYQVKIIIDETVMGGVRLNEPTDIFVDDSDRTFILDAGNCRVVILDQDYRCIKELKEFTYEGQTVTLKEGAKGLFYRESNDKLYIADTENDRILVSDLEGNLTKIYGKPVDELLNPEDRYKPEKVIVDNMGIMYVASGTVNTGAMMMDSNNSFLGFYGTNKLKMTAEMQLEYFWRSILSDAMNAQSEASFQPVQYYNLFWSKDRFVYAVSPVNEKMAATVVKLNALGENVFVQNTDFVAIQRNSGASVQSNMDHISGKGASLQLADITVDDEGAYTIIDQTTGRLYQFDENCNLLAIFGGLGYQKGLFTRPVSIECDSQNNLLILDQGKNTITVMEQTYYGQKIRAANYLYNRGMYQESIEPWMDVLRMNANYTLAYVGLGKAYIGTGDYEKAMDYFKNGNDQSGYAEAKAALRDETVREYFGLVAAIVVAVLILILFYDQLADLAYKINKTFRKKKGE